MLHEKTLQQVYMLSEDLSKDEKTMQPQGEKNMHWYQDLNPGLWHFYFGALSNELYYP